MREKDRQREGDREGERIIRETYMTEAHALCITNIRGLNHITFPYLYTFKDHYLNSVATTAPLHVW